MKSENIIKGVCYHEAGHWVAARQLGFIVGEIRITVQKNGKLFGHSGSAKIFPRLQSNTKEDLEKYLRNRISILFSGVIAQTLCIENKCESTAGNLLSSDGADDYKTINELFYILRGLCYPYENSELDSKQILQLQKECWEHSNQVVKKHEEDIAAIALKLEGRIKSMNKEYVFNCEELASWLPNLPFERDCSEASRVSPST